MSAGLVVFLAGLFVMPVALLWVGHRLRRRSPAVRGMFWGAVIGHCIAGLLAVVLGMIPPEAWTSEQRVRGFAGLWSLLVFPLAGGIVGRIMNRAD